MLKYQKISIKLIFVFLLASIICAKPLVSLSAGGNSPSLNEYTSGMHMAQTKIAEILRHNGCYPSSIAVKVWGKDVAGAEGVSISVAMYALGVKPQWDAAGNITGVDIINASDLGRQRIDAFIIIDGDISDNFKPAIIYMDSAYRKVLACSYNTLINKYPELKDSLDSTLKPIGNYNKGNETLNENPLAAHWAEGAKSFLAKGTDPVSAGEMSLSLRMIDSSKKELPKDAEVINTSVNSTNTMEIIFGNGNGSGTGSGNGTGSGAGSGDTGSGTGSAGTGNGTGSGAGSVSNSNATGIVNSSGNNAIPESTKAADPEKAIVDSSKEEKSKEGYGIATTPQNEVAVKPSDGGSSGKSGGGSGTGHVYEVSVENQQVPKEDIQNVNYIYLFALSMIMIGMFYQNKKGYLR
ncbi:MAG: cobaltochelatase subunit CobN [Thermoanaerobacteraceae bacterium]|nr:cobaltochelatase subunit CobN [Thermoanaerobacteraceae bacterium]